MMKFNIALVLIICTINANAFILQQTERVRRSTDESFVNRFRSGVKNFASGIKDLTVKGVEEVKNIFSKDRNVGDYRLHQLDVRFGEDEELNVVSTTSKVEEKSINENQEEKREKREAKEDLSQQEMLEIMKSIEDQFGGQSSTTEGK